MGELGIAQKYDSALNSILGTVYAIQELTRPNSSRDWTGMGNCSVSWHVIAWPIVLEV